MSGDQVHRVAGLAMRKRVSPDSRDTGNAISQLELAIELEGRYNSRTVDEVEVISRLS
jgi:hypothetical protein